MERVYQKSAERVLIGTMIPIGAMILTEIINFRQDLNSPIKKQIHAKSRNKFMQTSFLAIPCYVGDMDMPVRTPNIPRTISLQSLSQWTRQKDKHPAHTLDDPKEEALVEC